MLELNGRCTGCGACSNACPTQCIDMKYDKDGFLHPVIDEQNCIKCGLCEKTCPILNGYKRNNYIAPEAYGCWNTNQDVLLGSTSGGVFSAIAEYTIRDGGIVFASRADEDLNVHFTNIKNIEDLAIVRGSKYIQSEPRDVYSNIRETLIEEKPVFFTGTPCQVAGLYAYLQNIDCEKLITADLVCHGVGSTNFFQQYINENEIKNNSKISKFIARDKKRGWDNLTVKHEYRNKSVRYIKSTSDVFMKAYYSGLIYRESCYQCPFSTIPRIGDLTLGDYFGIDKKTVSQEHFSKGISLVLVNNENGKKIFDGIRSNLTYIERDLREATDTNSCLIKPISRHQQRDEFFKNYFKMTMRQIDKAYCQYSWKTKVSLLLGKRLTKTIQIITHRLKKRTMD